MGSSDQFGGSSDEDDEDEGWLTQSTFGVPVASRTFSERRPLSSNGFGVRVIFSSMVSFLDLPCFCATVGRV